MSWNQVGLRDENRTNTSEKDVYLEFGPKPIEMYVFIDPLCPECWSLEPLLKKLSIEYGRFFTVRAIVGNLNKSFEVHNTSNPQKLKEDWDRVAKRTGMSCDGDLWLEKPITCPWKISLAVKAAEIQGNRAGKTFLRKLQEKLFINKLDISNEDVLMRAADEANLDTEEFAEDLLSSTARKAFQCDIQLTREMEISHTPTIVFFNQATDEQGIKIAGLYPYEVYERILQEILQMNPIPSEKPPLETFLQMYNVVASQEISTVYDWTPTKTEKEMKKLQFKQKAQRIPVKYGTFWKYNY
ncbi:ClpXP adapter SpxH family protein [Oceanobacillus bengalensis]|uniref:ClpXP adapter protein SpxH n=1 Tax=Oceanobacillus bengalensis TaxID=1435466 RepID=A0A494YVE8_9BACI|nr:ClpXP adapter SpxH family protein [Oceanobacillus bengalensis]RKQ14142.1 DsbA family protein [Oceanobacillus bengalensis]